MFRTIALLMLATTIGCASGRGRSGGWDLLGQQQVSDRLDHDVISVGGARGDYRRIKIAVRQAPVDFYRVVVHFGNGADQRIDMRRTVKAGGESRVIDLDGSDRVIRSVEFWYDANTIRGRRALVTVFGRR